MEQEKVLLKMNTLAEVIGSKLGTDGESDLVMEQSGPITDIDKLKLMAEAIEVAKNRKRCELNIDDNLIAEELKNDPEMTSDDLEITLAELEKTFDNPTNTLVEKTSDNPKNTFDGHENSFDDPKHVFDHPQNALNDPEHSFEDSENTLEDSENTLEDSENTFDDPENTLDDTKNTLDDLKNTFHDHEMTFDDSEMTSDDSEMTIDDSEMTIDYSEMTMDDSLMTMDDSLMTMDDSDMTKDDFDMNLDDSEMTIQHPETEEEEVLFPPIKHESPVVSDELEQIREQILLDNSKADEEEGKLEKIKGKEVLFPAIKHESSVVSDELEQIQEQILLDNSKAEEEEGKLLKIRGRPPVENEQVRQAHNELEKIQLQILVDNIQAAETLATKNAETPKELLKEPDQPSKKINRYAWKESNSLPEGWKIKKTRNMSFVKELLLSPEEYIFCSRREALKSLVDTEASDNDIKSMHCKLNHEGWKNNENLPDAWKVRKTRFQTFFCTENGSLIKSCKDALKYIELAHTDMIDKFSSNFKDKVSKDEQKDGWEESNSVPKDWKIRRAEGKTKKLFFLSPQGIQFSSRIKALQYLRKEKFDEEDISDMRSTLSHDKYKLDQNLPEGWMFKKLISRSQTLILTSFGDLVESFKKVMFYTQFLGIHSEEVIDNLRIFSKPSSSENKKKYVWKEDVSVPAGWKIRTIKGKAVSILDPNGNQFKNRREALQHLVKNKESLQLVNELRKCLVHEGWKENHNLPQGWFFKKNRKNIFLSSEGLVIKQEKNLINFIKRRLSKNYAQVDLDNINTFIQTRNMSSREKNQLWVDDPTIPNGWKSKKSEGKTGRTSILSPDGSRFQSRKRAYLHMIEQNYPTDQLADMREKMSLEGWEENELLPDGWIFRINELHEELIFISSEGLLFRDTKMRVLEFVKTSEKYNDEDYEGLEMFYEIEYSRRIAEKYEWVESDETVPEGWKYRIDSATEKKHFLSPEGRTFLHRTAALKHMVKFEYPQEDINEMLTKFNFDGWNDDELLPKGWKYKVQDSINNKWTINLLSREGEEFNDSKLKVIEFLTSGNGYSEDDSQRMEMFYEIENNRQRKLKYEWLEDEDVVPFGWKYRAEGRKAKMFFLSPDGNQFSSRHSALQHMITSFYQDEEIEEMRNCLTVEGWVANYLLPAGWRYKKSEKKFLVKNGDIVKGFAAALTFISSNVDYDANDVANLQKLQGDKVINWIEDDDTVPYGWKVNPSYSKFNPSALMSPDGVQFASRFLAFQYLIKTDCDYLEVEDMREKLSHEGWNESACLPSGWKFKKEKNEGMQIVSKEGETFPNDKLHEAKVFMENSGIYGQDYVDSLELFLIQETNPIQDTNILQETKPSNVDSIQEWVEDYSVPYGWKIKMHDVKNFGKMCLLSPNGISHPTRKTALQSMLGSGSSKEEVAAMRKLMCHEGWKESDFLPENWLYKSLASNSVNLLTDNGKELKSKESVLDILTDSKDIEQMDLFYDMIGAQKQLDRYHWLENQDTVPKGWKLRIVGGNSGKETLLSPKGTSFSSRKIALQFLINSGAPEIEINTMREKMVHEGWKESELLPFSWIYKFFGAHAFAIITEEGTETKSKETTLENMKKSSREYSEEDFEKMRMFFEMIFAQKKLMKYEWKEQDESVPVGWKVNSKNTLLSPDGNSFASRKLALKSLVKNGGIVEEIENMRDKLSYEGWKTSDMLPEKWNYKMFGSKCLKIVTREGVEIKDSKQNAITVMKSNNYSSDDLERLDTFFEMVYAKGRLSSSAWKEDFDTLPKGWKSRALDVKSGKNNFLCPEGLPFTNRKAGYQHMIEAKYDPSEVDDMRRKLVHESWQFHELLPHDWVYKVLQYGARTIICILTSEGTEMKDSKLMVTEFMRSVDKYTEEDFNKLGKFFETETGKLKNVKQEWSENLPAFPQMSPEDHETIPQRCSTGKLKNVKQEWSDNLPSIPQVLPENHETVLQRWSDHSTVPHGWKFRKEGSSDCFLSPDNFQFTSRSKSLNHMVSTKFYTDKQIREMRSFLRFESWEESSDLPENWLFRENRSETESMATVTLITPEGEVMESMEASMDVIKTIYSGVQIVKMQKFIKEHLSIVKQEIEEGEFGTLGEIGTPELIKDTSSELENNCHDDMSDASENMEEEEMDSYVPPNIPMIKQAVINQPKAALDAAELDKILATGNFTSSVVKQIKSERKKSHQELDMAELDSILTEGNFTSDIIGQIMRKMKSPNSNINLQTINIQETRKRKSEEWEQELRRFRKRFV